MGLRLNLMLLMTTYLVMTLGHDILKRSIDLSASHHLIQDTKLRKDVVPTSYIVDLRPELAENKFTGNVKIQIVWNVDSRKITLHAHSELEINEKNITLRKLFEDESDSDEYDGEELLAISDVSHIVKKSIMTITLKDEQKAGTKYELEIPFSGHIWETTEGLFGGNYIEDGSKFFYYATYMRPHNARRLFPCFDEPEFKVPFTVSISRSNDYSTLFNTPLNYSEVNTATNTVVDYFQTTKPMSTFTFGFIISQFAEIETNKSFVGPTIKIWTRNSLKKDDSFDEVYEKIHTVYNYFKKYFDIDIPLSKLDIVGVPNLRTMRPADNWGLIIMKETDLLNKEYYAIAQEIVYQWLGAWVTPYWWNDAHVNKALASFLASKCVLELTNGEEFNGKYPMTFLYSLYYEFSKRYPHSRITGMKQETTSFKTELVLRMINYVLGENTFKTGLRKFVAQRHFSIFYSEDLWEALTKQAHEDKTLDGKLSIKDIADSWITKDRLPVVTLERNYKEKTGKVYQRVYLRERPHDVPDQDKMLWWIPLITVTQDKLDFTGTPSYVWLNKVKEIKLPNLPEEDKFIIINPEEMAPFPVNYDERNWNLLAQFLQTEHGRTKIPIYTRAKLLHDAWNLAYAGNLNFGTAFNMTLFMRFERDHLAWNPIFSFIDHIGRHIDMSAVHKKFQTYVRVLLTPLYEELGKPVEGEQNWKVELRSYAKTFLCIAGYRPCIEEAQAAFKKWMDSNNPDEGNPVQNQYICPVFKWGTMEEWEFGLERVINFPSTRVPSERTYLLKSLAGCPVQPEKIQRLLNITILEENGNFTENDISLIFSMLTGGSSGYTTLFNFLSENWDVIRQRFESKTNLWDNLISSATGIFTTQEGYDMVTKLFQKRRGEFGSAEHIIEKSLKNIKEETKWSDENLPVIENWLDDFLKRVNTSDNKFMG